MKSNYILFPLLILCFLLACQPKEAQDSSNTEAEFTKSGLFEKSNLVAWCIVPFDSEKRGPLQRAEMLQELGVTKLAYDWRQEHLPTFEEELKALREHNIELQSVWFWIDQDSAGYLGEDNEALWSKMVANDVQTECWFSFAPQFFEGLTDDEKRSRAIAFISDFRDRAKQQGCTLGMYNHGDWFGNPLNQLAIIDSLGDDHLGMVYNFHHAHHEIDEFETLLEQMQDHLLCINLNGMVKEGEKIIALGEGDQELTMMQTIQNSDYQGPIGIIGHQADKDVKVVLQQNLAGLQQLKAELE